MVLICRGSAPSRVSKEYNMHKLQLMTVRQISVISNILPYMVVCFNRLTLQMFPVDLSSSYLFFNTYSSTVAMQTQMQFQAKCIPGLWPRLSSIIICVCKHVCINLLLLEVT